LAHDFAQRAAIRKRQKTSEKPSMNNIQELNCFNNEMAAKGVDEKKKAA
jgi:hypothetical protein